VSKPIGVRKPGEGHRSCETQWQEKRGPKVDITEAEMELRTKAAAQVAEIMLQYLEECRFKDEVQAAEAQGMEAQWWLKFEHALAMSFDHRGMRHAAAVWRKWLTWREEQPNKMVDNPAAPAALNVALFLDDMAMKGPTAVWGILSAVKWLKTHAGLEGMPLDSPLIKGHKAPGSARVPKQAEELALAIWKRMIELADEDQGAVSLVAREIVFLIASSLRFRHAQRASFVLHMCNAQTIVVEVSRGKVNKGAPYRVGIPTHVAPGMALLLQLYHELTTENDNPGYMFPDIDTRKGLNPESEISPDKPMSYGKFMGCLRAILLAMGLTAEDLRDITTYSLRRKLPTVADRLRLPMEARDELGNWQESIGTAEGARRKAREPMAVRYSEAKLESAAQTRRVCLLALSKLAPEDPEDDATRRMAKGVPDMQEAVLGPEWGVTPNKKEESGEEEVDKEKVEVPDSDSDSGTSEDSKASGTASSDGGERIEARLVEWLLPAGSKSKLHLCSDQDDEQGHTIPWCRRTAFKWGCQKGMSREAAESTGRDWSPRCRTELARRTATALG